MLRQAVFLCLLLAGMAKAQVDNYIISSIFVIVLKVVAIMGHWKWKIGSESFLLQERKFGKVQRYFSRH